MKQAHPVRGGPFLFGCQAMTSSTSMRESRVKLAPLKRSFMQAERLAKDGEAGV